MTAFDYVVVGAGSAGCVLADRLTRSGRHTVALIEAGPSDRRFFVRMPIGYGKTFYDPQINWMYTTEPVPGLGGRPSYWPRGKILGGSSSINAMVYVRGLPHDFDDWAAAAGDPGWGWAGVLPVFRRMEDHALGASGSRGAGGPLHVSDVGAQMHPLSHVYLDACRQYGLPVVEDINAEAGECAGLYNLTTHGGVRVSAATAYLAPARRRSNLHVETGSLATRILFDGQRAVGVEVRRPGGAAAVVRARREVILSGGAINSPQLLMLSGVGPAEALRRHGIAVVADRPGVGRNLQDHLGLDHLFRSRVPTLNEMLRPWHGKLRQGLRYVLTRRGPLGLSVNQGGGFARSSPAAARPDVQLYFSPVSYTRAPPGRRPLMNPDPFPGFLLGLSMCRPRSRGFVELRSADPAQSPLIQPNYLADERDAEALAEGSLLLRRIAAMPALRAVAEEELKPGPGIAGREAILRDARERAGSVFHPCGTCIMGTDARASVVDARLRVRGVEALRVIDASIFPNVTSGNTNAPALMVGEKGADLVLEDG